MGCVHDCVHVCGVCIRAHGSAYVFVSVHVCVPKCLGMGGNVRDGAPTS